MQVCLFHRDTSCAVSAPAIVITAMQSFTNSLPDTHQGDDNRRPASFFLTTKAHQFATPHAYYGCLSMATFCTASKFLTCDVEFDDSQCTVDSSILHRQVLTCHRGAFRLLIACLQECPADIPNRIARKAIFGLPLCS